LPSPSIIKLNSINIAIYIYIQSGHYIVPITSKITYLGGYKINYMLSLKKQLTKLKTSSYIIFFLKQITIDRTNYFNRYTSI